MRATPDNTAVSSAVNNPVMNAVGNAVSNAVNTAVVTAVGDLGEKSAEIKVILERYVIETTEGKQLRSPKNMPGWISGSSRRRLYWARSRVRVGRRLPGTWSASSGGSEARFQRVTWTA